MKLTRTSPPANMCAMSKLSRSMLQTSRHEAQERGEQSQHQSHADEIRHTEDAHLGHRRFEQSQQESGPGELADIDDGADHMRRKTRRNRREAPGRENAGDQ